MLIRVDEYPGTPERPCTFRIRERVLKVLSLLDRWYGSDHDYFKVQADDGYNYIILHDRATNEWRLVSLTKSESDTPEPQ